jgi:hypothetical protein
MEVPRENLLSDEHENVAVFVSLFSFKVAMNYKSTCICQSEM